MKMKLFLFISLFIGSVGAAALFAQDTHASDQVTGTRNISSHLQLFAVGPGIDATANPNAGVDATADPDGGLDPEAGLDVDASTKDAASNCKVEGIGWIICPVVREISKVVDAAYVIVGSLLTVSPLLTTGASGDAGNIYAAWQVMRNFANIVFVIAFMFLIFSQITSIGLNNYGIKKMLPRLIIAAILVNASYWICALAVDISNILGASLNELFKTITDQAALPVANNQTEMGTQKGWAGLTVAVIAATGLALYVGLSALLPAILAAVVAILTVLVVLSLRQALIILLVVVSPLAFVAYLLPNTESLFKKWLGLFKTLLLMYPIIAMIFGASALASSIVLATESTDTNKDYWIVIQIMGGLMAIIPLALTPIIMKTAGGVLGRVGGFVNNPNKGPFDRARKGAERIRNNQEDKRAIRAMNGGPVIGRGKYQRRAKREAIDQGIKKELGYEKSQFVAEEIASNSRFQNQVAGGSRGVLTPDATPAALQRALAGAQFTIDNAVADNIKAEAITVRDFGKDQLKAVLTDDKASDERKAAAVQRLIKIADPGDMQLPDGTIDEGYAKHVNKAMGSDSSILRRATAQALGSDGPGFVKASDVDSIATGANKYKDAQGVEHTIKLDMIAAKNVGSGVYSEKKIVEDTAGNLRFAYDAAAAADRLDNGNRVKLLKDNADALINNDNLKGEIKHNAAAINNLAMGRRP
ncbi:MAG TPA: hypothetical protein VF281_03730 [Candidatus Saccharimonadales bacterium]